MLVVGLYLYSALSNPEDLKADFTVYFSHAHSDGGKLDSSHSCLCLVWSEAVRVWLGPLWTPPAGKTGKVYSLTTEVRRAGIEPATHRSKDDLLNYSIELLNFKIVHYSDMLTWETTSSERKLLVRSTVLK